jgi:acylphosphatase
VTALGALARARLRITGRVQGVGFRFYARREAVVLGLNGWVRNDADGSVELVAQGPRARVDAMIRWCHDGPPHSRVDAVEVTWEPAAADLSGFDVAG